MWKLDGTKLINQKGEWKSNVDWKVAVNGFALDKRVGSSHLDVPGHDGKLGFGGSCFPKDVEAFTNFTGSEILKVVMKVNDNLLRAR